VASQRFSFPLHEVEWQIVLMVWALDLANFAVFDLDGKSSPMEVAPSGW
jgi:hypothetical protein